MYICVAHIRFPRIDSLIHILTAVAQGHQGKPSPPPPAYSAAVALVSPVALAPESAYLQPTAAPYIHVHRIITALYCIIPLPYASGHNFDCPFALSTQLAPCSICSAEVGTPFVNFEVIGDFPRADARAFVDLQLRSRQEKPISKYAWGGYTA